MKHKLLALLIGMIFGCLHISVLGQKNSWERYIQSADNAITQNRYAEAEQAYREALKLSEKFKEKDPRIAVNLIKLAESLNLQAKGQEAESFAHSALEALEKAVKVSKSKDPEGRFSRLETSVTILDKAADIFAANQKYAEAEPLYKRVVALREEALQPKDKPKSNEDFLSSLAQAMTHPQAKLAEAYHKLANLYFRQDRFAEAEPLFFKALKATEAEYGNDKPPAAIILSELAALYALQSKYDKAEPLYSRAVSIFENSNWLDKSEAASTFENYSLLLRKTGREAEAATMLEKAKAIRVKIRRNTN